jgi:hypothetical protein
MSLGIKSRQSFFIASLINVTITNSRNKNKYMEKPRDTSGK